MSRLGQRDTAPELALRSELHRRGLRFRIDQRPLPDLRSRADLVFRRASVAVYVDGCFWHGCPEHGTMPKANFAFWRQKLARNRERDAETDARLRAESWEVVRVWEHEDVLVAADRIEQIVTARLRSDE